MPKPRNTKKFIDKNNAVTFHLVHRSQQDPLITDETAPQRVLVESEDAQRQKPSGKIDVAKRKKEQQKFGVFFDDDYDYLQHLREPEIQNVEWELVAGNKPDKEVKKPTINLPSSVFASEFEEKEGLLRKSAPRYGPRPDWDPDIVAALDDDFNFDDPENELDDNFMEKAMDDNKEDGESFSSNDSEYSDIDSNFNDDEEDDDEEKRDGLGPLRMHSSEEIKSRFTEYSMSSSVIRRNEQLALLDERFEKFFENYDEPDIGPLDCEEIEGHVEIGDDLLTQCMVELKKNDEIEPYNSEWDKERVKKLEKINSDSDAEEMIELEIDDCKKKWDCESILSTYSNIYNHPKIIDEPHRRRQTSNKISINPKTGVPLNVFHGENTQLTVKSLAKFDNENKTLSDGMGPKSICAQSVLSTLSVLSIRPKDETPDEKSHRKRLLREYRQERRIERKANALAFKEEKKRQEKIKLNNRNNLQGNKIV